MHKEFNWIVHSTHLLTPSFVPIQSKWLGWGKSYGIVMAYMEVIAEDADGNTVRKRTRYIQGNANPDWNQWLYFGNRAWKKYKVRIYDDDDNADDPLSSQYTRTVYWGSHTSKRFDCYDGGYAVYA